MEKLRVGIVFGGKSAEHEVSLQSAKNIVDAIDKSRFDVVLLGIDKQGQWHVSDASNYLLNADDPAHIALRPSATSLAQVPGKHERQLIDAPHARTEQEMLEQGRSLLAMGCGAVLMKGGHLDDEQSPDWLFTREGEQRFTAPRIMTKNTHGTGCTLSAALAALRPRHTNWADTVQEAKSWLSSALAQADTLEVGHGIGPVHHFHAWW